MVQQNYFDKKCHLGANGPPRMTCSLIEWCGVKQENKIGLKEEGEVCYPMECIGHTFHPSLSPFISTTHCTNAIGWARVGA